MAGLPARGVLGPRGVLLAGGGGRMEPACYCGRPGVGIWGRGLGTWGGDGRAGGMGDWMGVRAERVGGGCGAIEGGWDGMPRGYG